MILCYSLPERKIQILTNKLLRGASLNLSFVPTDSFVNINFNEHIYPQEHVWKIIVALTNMKKQLQQHKNVHSVLLLMKDWMASW